jgi:hypothetical protein
MAFRRWFPRSLQAQATFYAGFTRVFVENAGRLGFTAEEIAKMEADNAVMQYLAQTEVNIKAFKKGFQSLRNNLTRGEGILNPIYINLTPLPEPPIVPYGMFDRLFNLADRIETSDAYTTGIGAQLGILPKGKEALRPEDLHLKLKLKPRGGEVVEVCFVRGRTSGVNLFYRRSGSEEFFDLGRYFYSPAIVKVPLLDAEKPEQIFIGGRYLIGNEPVGKYSSMFPVIVAP